MAIDEGMLLLALLLVLSCSPVISSEDSGRCHCNGHVVCKKINDIDELKNQLDASDCQSKQLKVKKCELPTLPDGLLQLSKFSRFRIQDTIIYFLYPDFFEGSPFSGGQSVLDFTLENVMYPYNWNWTHLNEMRNLNALRMIKSDFIYVPESFSTVQIPSLQVLIIDRCGVKWIHERAFASLHGIAYFHLIGNEIKHFKRNYLPVPAEYLHVLSLRSNKIAEIDRDLFTEMPSLKFVNLESNNIKTLSDQMILPLTNNKFFINLADNRLLCDCSVRWILDQPRTFDTKKLKCWDDIKSKMFPMKKVIWEMMGCKQYVQLEVSDDDASVDSSEYSKFDWTNESIDLIGDEQKDFSFRYMKYLDANF